MDEKEFWEKHSLDQVTLSGPIFDSAFTAEELYRHIAERIAREYEAARKTRSGIYEDGVETMVNYAFPIVRKEG